MTISAENSGGLPMRRGVPRVPSTIIVRKAVREKLERWAPLTILRAPFGYGKTTAVASWIRDCVPPDVQTVWVDIPHRARSTDKTARDHLWREILLAMRHPEALSVEDPRSAVRQGVMLAGRRMLVVIDGIEKLTSDEDLKELVDFLRIHDGVHVILCSRNTVIADVLIEQHLDVLWVYGSDLAFDPDDVVAMFTSLGIECDGEQAQKICSELSAWPTLIHQAALLMLKPPAADRASIEGVAVELRRVIGRTLIPELLEPDELRTAASLSVATHLTPGAVSVFAEDFPDISNVLADFEARGVMVRQAGPSGSELGIPPFVRRVLFDHAMAASDIDVVGLQRKLAHAHMASFEFMALPDQLALTVDPTLLAQLLTEAWIYQFIGGQGLLGELLDRIPAKTLERYPVVKMLRSAWLAFDRPFSGTKVDRLPEEKLAELAAEADPDANTHLAALLAHRSLGYSSGAARIAEKIPAFVAQLHAAASPLERFQLHHLLTQAGATLQLSDSHSNAVDVLSVAYENREDDPLGMATKAAAGGIAWSLAYDGYVDSAQQWLDIEERLSTPNTWMSECSATAGLLARALSAMESLDLNSARKTLARLELVRDADPYWSQIMCAQADWERCWGDPLSMLDRIRRERDRRGSYLVPGSSEDRILRTAMVDLHLSLGHGSAAWAELVELPVECPATLIRQARFALVVDDPEQALEVSLQGDSVSTRLRVEYLLVLAAARLDLGNEHRASIAMNRALVRMRDSGMTLPLLSIPREKLLALTELVDDAGLVHEAIGRGLPVAYPGGVQLVSLTDRESRVLDGLARGFSNESMARADFVSVNTIKSQVASLYRKLGVKSRSDAVVRGRELGLLR